MKKNSTVKTNKPELLFDASGEKVGVLLSKKEYEKLMSAIDDYHDYQAAMAIRKKRKTK